jgi:hypothetical protein
MRRVDQLKVGVLVVAISIWGWGAKTANHRLMLTGIGLVIVAFGLRLVPRSREDDPS